MDKVCGKNIRVVFSEKFLQVWQEDLLNIFQNALRELHADRFRKGAETLRSFQPACVGGANYPCKVALQTKVESLNAAATASDGEFGKNLCLILVDIKLEEWRNQNVIVFSLTYFPIGYVMMERHYRFILESSTRCLKDSWRKVLQARDFFDYANPKYPPGEITKPEILNKAVEFNCAARISIDWLSKPLSDTERRKIAAVKRKAKTQPVIIVPAAPPPVGPWKAAFIATVVVAGSLFAGAVVLGICRVSLQEEFKSVYSTTTGRPEELRQMLEIARTGEGVTVAANVLLVLGSVILAGSVWPLTIFIQQRKKASAAATFPARNFLEPPGHP